MRHTKAMETDCAAFSVSHYDSIGHRHNILTELPLIPAQPALYMHQNGLKYGFITTYEETIFLKQVRIGGTWTLYDSKSIKGGRTLTGGKGDDILTSGFGFGSRHD